MCSAQTDLKPILIAGATASGKSALAMAIAERVGGAIINADSMQVYRELRVLTARPTPADEARVPHALYGFVPASEAYSAGRFVRDAGDAIAKAQGEGRRPIIVGGTGLYFKALLEGLSPIPEIRDEVREYWRGEATRRGAGSLHAELTERDPVVAARLQPADTQRIVRALEVLQSTGRSLAEWQTLKGQPVLNDAETVRFVVQVDRAELHARADVRFAEMIRDGGIAEVQALSDMQLDGGLPAMRAIGVRPLLRAIRCEISLDESISASQAETRQYIKRQETWHKSHMITWYAVKTKSMESSMREIFAFIQSKR
ncbi:tRNA (adenosine(37)-N6)-dimethylallyltransferase MiaA [Hyphomicrobium sp.]|jgi:tRNA dimethylallyltransferase|uniref:tRNA (adenosine(37)-N6)-dimethylallyltransferase MiaA n=1 Tax=Hyphomicrobium sp. TaxID=82 RepID=UPI00356222E5